MWNELKSGTGTSETDFSAAEIARLTAELERERVKGQRYRLAAESATNLIYEWDLGSRVEWIGHVDELLGYQPNEVPRTWEGYTSLFHSEDRDRVLAAIEKQLKSEEPYCVECRVRRKDGTYLYWQDRGSVVRDESGKPVKWLGAITDITERKRTQDALAASEEKFRKAFYTSPDSVNINRLADGLYVSINKGFTKIMGYAEQEIVGRTSVELNIWDDPDDRRRLIAGLQKDGLVENLEARFRAKNGDLKYGLMSAALIEIDGLPHILSITRDITERKQAEKLRDILFQIANVANSTVSLDELFCSIHGSIGALLPADNFSIALHDPAKDEIAFPYFVDQYSGPPPSHQTGRGLIEYVLRTGAPLLAPPQVFESLVRQGQVELTGENSVDWVGVPLRIGERTIGVMVVRSYTEKVRFGKRELDILSFVSSQIAMAIERKRAEGMLVKSEKRFRTLSDLLPQIVFETDIKGTLTFANQYGIKSFGYSLEDLPSGVNIFALVAPENRESIKMRLQEILSGSETAASEFQVMRKDGGIFPILMHASAILEDGVPIGVRGIAIDITERKRSEEKLRESEKKYRELYDFLPIPVYEMDLEANITAANRAIFDTFRGTEDDFKKGFNAWRLLSPEDTEKSAENIHRLLKGEQIGGTEYNFKRLDGSVFPAIVISSVIYSHDQPVGLRGAIIDITELRKAEGNLRRMNAFLDSIVENIPNMIFLKDARELRFVRFNRAGEDLLGYSRDDLLGKNDYDFFPKEQADLFTGKDREVLSGKELVEIREESLQTRHKGERILHTQKVPILNANGEPEYLLGISEDITERKRAEEAIRVSLQEKEVLLREIHHRVKNNMQVISSLFNLQAGHTLNEDCRSILKEAQTRIRSMSLVHEKLYQSGQLSRIDFGGYINSLAVHLVHVYRPQPDLVRLETDFEDVTLDIASAMPCGLLLNELISNALKHAFPENRAGVVRIALKRGTGGLIKVRVADDGVGFPEDLDFAKAESFGLQIVNLLIRQLEATIELDRTNGTAFTVTFRELEYPSRA